MSSAFYQWHEHPRLLATGDTGLGRVVIWLCATGLLIWHGVTLIMPTAVALVVLLPTHRRRIAGIAAVGTLIQYFATRSGLPAGAVLSNPADWLRPLILIVTVLTGLYLAYRLGRQAPSWPASIRRHPVMVLHAGFWVGLALTRLFPPFAILTELGPWLIWRLSFLLQSAGRGQVKNTTFSDHLLYLWPAFGGTSTPYGKGLDYLARHEARDTMATTASQVAGIKLLILGLFWQQLLLLMDVLIFGVDHATLPTLVGAVTPHATLGVPRLGDAIATAAVSVGPAWASLYLELVRATLRIAAAGHVVIGCLRLLGFNVFRNTYKPLLAESIVEFWNRFYFYFKELLVEFFFYPVFLRSAWAGPRLRMFLAVFAAACIGNMYYHVLIDSNLLASGDLGAMWQQWNSRLIYCLLLATGIWISMMRQQARRRDRAPRAWLSRLRAIAGVWTFYALIHIWNVRSPDSTISDRGEFILRLVGFS